jgi:hypothetical protein
MLDFSLPIQTRHGWPVKILTMTRKSSRPIVAIATDPTGCNDDLVLTCTIEGYFSFAPGQESRYDLVNVLELNPPHQHSAVIQAWAQGVPIQYRPQSRDNWTDCKTPSWQSHVMYRIKPGYESLVKTS